MGLICLLSIGMLLGCFLLVILKFFILFFSFSLRIDEFPRVLTVSSCGRMLFVSNVVILLIWVWWYLFACSICFYCGAFCEFKNFHLHCIAFSCGWMRVLFLRDMIFGGRRILAHEPRTKDFGPVGLVWNALKNKF